MRKVKSQDKSEGLIVNKSGDKTRFEVKSARDMVWDIASIVAGILIKTRNWKRVLQRLVTPKGSESLVNYWLRIDATPELTYARVEINPPGNARRIYR